MGLKSQPEFEAETQAETATTTKEVNTMNTTNTSVAPAATNTGVAVSRGLAQSFADKHAVFDVTTVEGLALSVPRIKGEQGSLFSGETDLGETLQFEIVSISPRWIIGTGTNDVEAKDKFRVSYDNQTCAMDGMNLNDYLAELKALGYDKAKKSDYLDIFGFVVSSAKGGKIDVEARELACLQCSPTSKGAFVAFATTRGLLEARGIAKPLDVIEVHAEKRVSGSNKYTNFSFRAPK